MATHIAVEIEHVADSDAEELSRVTHSFASQALGELDVLSVDFANDREAPVGTKAGDASSLGQLVVVAVPSVAVLRGLISLARAKVAADATKTVKLTVDGDSIEITNPSGRLQEDMVRTWLARVAENAADE